MTKAWVSTSEAARMLGVSQDTVLRWIRSGILSAWRADNGCHWRVNSASIQLLIGGAPCSGAFSRAADRSRTPRTGMTAPGRRA